MKKSKQIIFRSLFSNDHFNLRAQLEIIGLVFIVLIVSMAMLFYLSYSVNHEDKQVFKKYADNELGMSYATVFTKTSICGTEMSKLLEDCATTKRIVCAGGLNSCETLNKTIIRLLSQTLDKWDKAYGFTIRWTDSPLNDDYTSNWQVNGENAMYFDNEKWVYTRRNCTEETTGIRRAPGISPIPLGMTGDTITVEIGMCAQ